jgi:hypothetical protein
MPDRIIPAPPISGRVGPVIPVLGRRYEYLPTVGSWLVVSLPGEDVRTKVIEVKSRDVIVVELVGHVGVVRGGHQYKTRDILAVQRGESEGRLNEIWIPISEREVRMREDAERLAAQAVELAMEAGLDESLKQTEEAMGAKAVGRQRAGKTAVRRKKAGA